MAKNRVDDFCGRFIERLFRWKEQGRSYANAIDEIDDD